MKGKKKVLSVHDMKGNRGIAPLILKLGAGWMLVVNIRPWPKVHLEE